MAPFNLGRSVSTHSPNHGRLREGGWESKVEGVGRGLEVVERFALKGLDGLCCDADALV